MQKQLLPDDLPSSVITQSSIYPDGHVTDWHSHSFAQLVYACSGVMTVRVADSLWVIPPQRAVWVPSGISHKVSKHGQAHMRSLYVRPDAFNDLPENSCVLTVSPLMRELILHLCSLPERYEPGSEEERITQVIMDQLKNATFESFYLPETTDKRLKPVCQAIQAHPENSQTLIQWASHVNISSRALSRLFRTELGLSLVQYRQQVRLLEALKKLAKGEPVTRVAMDVGFSSLSAFNRLFRRSFGKTPGVFFN